MSLSTWEQFHTDGGPCSASGAPDPRQAGDSGFPAPGTSCTEPVSSSQAEDSAPQACDRPAGTQRLRTCGQRGAGRLPGCPALPTPACPSCSNLSLLHWAGPAGPEIREDLVVAPWCCGRTGGPTGGQRAHPAAHVLRRSSPGRATLAGAGQCSHTHTRACSRPYMLMHRPRVCTHVCKHVCTCSTTYTHATHTCMCTSTPPEAVRLVTISWV